MNIVFKLMECNGGPVAKISDSPGKTLRDAGRGLHPQPQAWPSLKGPAPSGT